MRPPVGYGLDDAGNRKQLTWPDSYKVDYAFDALNRLVQVNEHTGGATLANFTYDPLSRRTSFTEAGLASPTVSYTWSKAGDLSILSHSLTVSANNVTFDATNGSGVVTGIDQAHRLIKETVSNALYKWTGTTIGSTAYTPDRLNRYATVSGASYGYDANGNLTSDGTWTYGYDPENWLLTATKTGVSATYLYDPLGRRVKSTDSTTTVYLDADDEEIGEYSSAGALTLRYIPGPEIDRPIGWTTAGGGKRYFHADRRGSIIAVTKPTGELSEGPYSYNEYGLPSITSGTPIKYAGRRYDAVTGLYYYRARFYRADIGRYLQSDPSGYASGLNLYDYVQGDPINLTDPSGLQQAIPGPGVPMFLPPVFVPGSPENKQWSQQMQQLVVQARDAIRAGYNQLTHRNEPAPVPDRPVGTDPSDKNKNRTTSGPLAPEEGGTGDPEADFDLLTGGQSGPAPESMRYPPGTQLGTNGISYRPPAEGKGARIDIPAVGDKKPKPEGLHYPPPPPPPPPK